MKTKLLIILAAVTLSACSMTPTCYNYAKVGVGYKVAEAKLYTDGELWNEPVSGRIELGQQCDNISYGVSHHSQPFTGFPFNNEYEYHKTEIFVDYMYVF